MFMVYMNILNVTTVSFVIVITYAVAVSDIFICRKLF